MDNRKVLVIDGHEVSFEEGETILQVARRNGFDIPTLCHLKNASPTGACRICVVEAEGEKDLLASCATAAVPNMVVKTESPRVVQSRRTNLELLLASGDHNCLVQDMHPDTWTDFQLRAAEEEDHIALCPAYGDCRLQDLTVRYQIRETTFTPSETRYPMEKASPFIVRDFSRCIMCGRCVQACNDVQVNQAISYGYRGAESKIVTVGDRPYINSDCVFCGECLQACPVGALVAKKDLTEKRPNSEPKKIRTTCSYCGVGCQLYLHVSEGRVVKVTGVEDMGPNYGSLCAKGRFGFDFIHHKDRLTKPLIKENDRFREASWDEALSYVSEKLLAIKKASGPDAIGVLSSARITNEENYVAQKLTRAVLGTNNIDHCARL
jgi:predicted molibdopterin-dependent oxidoreductase YjgC